MMCRALLLALATAHELQIEIEPRGGVGTLRWHSHADAAATAAAFAAEHSLDSGGDCSTRACVVSSLVEAMNEVSPAPREALVTMRWAGTETPLALLFAADADVDALAVHITNEARALAIPLAFATAELGRHGFEYITFDPAVDDYERLAAGFAASRQLEGARGCGADDARGSCAVGALVDAMRAAERDAFGPGAAAAARPDARARDAEAERVAAALRAAPPATTVTPRCDARELALQPRRALEMLVLLGGCEHDDVLRFVQLALPSARTFVDVGANKGGFAARLLALWRPEYGVTPDRLRDARAARVAAARNATADGGPALLGACEASLANGAGDVCGAIGLGRGAEADDALTTIARERRSWRRRIAADAGGVRVLSVEASAALAASLRSLVARDGDAAFAPALPDGAWTVAHAVASDGTARELTFGDLDPEGCDANEVLTVLGSGAARPAHLADVPLAVRQARATSLDALLRRFPREDADDDSAGDEGDDAPIDVLKIDCEGHDPAVLRGARATLRRTRVLMFEVSGTGEWAGTRFSDVIQELDEAGFTCFWAGAHGLLRLTGCFHPTFDTEWWHRDATNAICASRVLAPSLAPLLETLTPTLGEMAGWLNL